jgi:hypothetical protein
MGSRSTGVAVGVAYDDRRALGMHPPRRGQADAAATTGDHCYPARQPSGEIDRHH